MRLEPLKSILSLVGLAYSECFQGVVNSVYKIILKNQLRPSLLTHMRDDAKSKTAALLVDFYKPVSM